MMPDWEIAAVVHRARMRECYGDNDARGKQPFPSTDTERRAYFHARNTWVDQALAVAKALREAGIAGSKEE